MNVVDEFLDVLQNIELVVAEVYGSDPTLRDADVKTAYEKLVFQLDRDKKKLPKLASAMPEKSQKVFIAIVEIVELRLNRLSTEIVAGDHEMGYKLPLRLMIPCISRLIRSINTFSSKQMPRMYLDHINKYV